jgi:hypothetical protein
MTENMRKESKIKRRAKRIKNKKPVKRIVQSGHGVNLFGVSLYPSMTASLKDLLTGDRPW